MCILVNEDPAQEGEIDQSNRLCSGSSETVVNKDKAKQLTLLFNSTGLLFRKAESVNLMYVKAFL